MKIRSLQTMLYITVSILVALLLFIGCKRKKEKEPASFFLHMKNLMTGKSEEIRKQVEKDIQAWLDKGHPELGLQLITAESMASMNSGAFDDYSFAVTDNAGLRFTSVWNNYNESSYYFMRDYQDAVLHKSYTDTLQSKLPEDIKARIFYRPQGHWEEPDNYMRFYIYSSEYQLDAKRKVYLVENIRKALRETIEIFGKQEFEGSLCFIHPEKAVINEQALYVQAELYSGTWLIGEIRNENKIPDFVLSGKISSKMIDSIKREIIGSDSYTYPEYFLIRQDDFSEFFYITELTSPATEETRTFVYGIYTNKLELKEKKEIVLPREKGYKYKEIEDIIPRRFHYRYVPKFPKQPPMNPFYNPFYNFY